MSGPCDKVYKRQMCEVGPLEAGAGLRRGRDSIEGRRAEIMNPEAGRRFGPYEIQERLGGGGMGHVYRAWDARLHRDVAIKLLHDEFAMPGMRERFLREARAASALNHPNICTIFDIGEQDGDPYLVMELLEGETLKDRIQRGPIPVDDLVCVAKDVAEGLAAAHAKGIVHRDIKPANIFLVGKPNGKVQAKVLDFGLAKIDGPLGVRGRHLDLTSAGSTVGTLAYMSPEQARGEVLDLRSDLFSFGVVMYEMATRQTPFQGATSALVFVKLLNHPPEPVREWNDQVSRELEKIILKLMAKERTARFQTAGELEQALVELDKPGGGGWLRKAMATVPLVRAPDPVVRERRTGIRKAAETLNDEDRQAGDPPPMKSSSSSEAQLLRPITRLPREDSTGRAVPAPEAREVTPLPLPEGFVERRSPESRRMRYHPDHDEIFERPSRRATDVARSGPGSVSASARVEGMSAGSESADATESASRQTLPEAAVPAVFVPAMPWGEDEDLREGVGEPDTEDDVFSAEAGAPVYREWAVAPFRGRQRRNSIRWIGVGVALAAVALGVVFVVNRGHFGATLLAEHDEVVLTGIENRTGDKMLDGSVAQGLQMALAQSPYLRMASTEAFLAARHAGGDEGMNAIRARTAAQRLGAKAYLYGSVVDGDVTDEKLRGTSAAYTLHVDLMSVSTNDVLGSYEEHAVSLQQLLGTIDRLADEVRASAGEDSDSIGARHNPLNREATGSMEALHAFTLGEVAQAEGRGMDALQQYQQAVTLDPRFVQAQLRLAVIYRKQKAEVAAAEAARAALAASDTTSERTRTLAQYEYEMNASGDFGRATELIRRLVMDHPHDAEALADLTRVLRLEGKLTEAVQAGEQATREDPFHVDAYIQTSSSLIGLDRYDAALQVLQQAERQGLPPLGGVLIGAYLGDRQDVLERMTGAYAADRPEYRSKWVYGLYLDNAGRLADGLAVWRGNAAESDRVKGLAGAAGYLLAQGALDRALVSDCGNGLALAREAEGKPRGVMGEFNTGMAEALCGDAAGARRVVEELRRVYPQSTEVNGYLVADLKAALALEANDPAAALEELKAARQYDLVSLTPYLRGRAHVAMRQVQIGIVDFQTVLSHRGITFIVGTDVYPVAEIGVARAFADTGDMANSAGAYRQFLGLWRDADPGLALMGEARAKTK